MQCRPLFLLDDPLSIVLTLGHGCDMVGKFTNSGAEVLDKILVDLEKEEDFSLLWKSGPGEDQLATYVVALLKGLTRCLPGCYRGSEEKPC